MVLAVGTAASGSEVQITVPAGMTYKSYSSSDYTCSFSAPTLTCTSNSALPTGPAAPVAPPAPAPQDPDDPDEQEPPDEGDDTDDTDTDDALARARGVAAQGRPKLHVL